MANNELLTLLLLALLYAEFGKCLLTSNRVHKHGNAESDTTTGPPCGVPESMPMAALFTTMKTAVDDFQKRHCAVFQRRHYYVVAGISHDNFVRRLEAMPAELRCRQVRRYTCAKGQRVTSSAMSRNAKCQRPALRNFVADFIKNVKLYGKYCSNDDDRPSTTQSPADVD